MPEQKRKFKVADFVSKIVKDPNAPPNTLLLQGYLGDSSDEGHVRLYLDPQLSDYVEIPEADILHTQEAPNSSLGETYVWINLDAELTHGKAGPQRLKASFLEGRLQQQFLGGAAAAAPQPGPIPTPPFSVLCPPHSVGFGCVPSIVLDFCPTRFPIACQSRLIYQCHTHAPYLCPVSVPVYQCHPSVATPCPSHSLTCQSVLTPCPSLPMVQCHPSVATPCQSQSLTCQSVLTPCISHNVPCPTQNPVQCPPASGGFGCGPVGPGPEQFAAAAAVQPPSLGPQQCPGAVVQHPTLLPHLCPSVFEICPSRVTPCHSVPIFHCPSVIDLCPSQLDPPCPSRIPIQCPSRILVQCPSVHPRPCPTGDFVPCPSAHPRPCPTGDFVPCPSVPVYQCPSRVVVQCPSVHLVACPPSIDPRTCVFDPGS